MKLKLILLMLAVLIIPTVYAIGECRDLTFPGIDCLVITPVITCDDFTYDITNSTQLVVNQSNLTEIDSTSIFFFTFNFNYEDAFLVRLCNNFTRTITTSFNATSIILSPVLGQAKITPIIYFIILLIAIGLFILGMFIKNRSIIFSSAACFFIIAVALLSVGVSLNTSTLTDTIDTNIGFSRSLETKNYETIKNSTTNTIAFILMVMSLIIIITTILSNEFKNI